MKKRILAKSILAALALIGIDGTAFVAEASSLRILSNPGSAQKCFSHVHRCIIPVYVHALASGQCSVWIDAAKIGVPPKDAALNRIKVIFVLKKGDPGTKIGQFKFDRNTGFSPMDPAQSALQFTSEGYDGADTDNPDNDDDIGAGPASRRFRLASTHLVNSIDIAFNLKVTRTTSGATCDSTDPTITNTN